MAEEGYVPNEADVLSDKDLNNFLKASAKMAEEETLARMSDQELAKLFPDVFGSSLSEPSQKTPSASAAKSPVTLTASAPSTLVSNNPSPNQSSPSSFASAHSSPAANETTTSTTTTTTTTTTMKMSLYDNDSDESCLISPFSKLPKTTITTASSAPAPAQVAPLPPPLPPPITTTTTTSASAQLRSLSPSPLPLPLPQTTTTTSTITTLALSPPVHSPPREEKSSAPTGKPTPPKKKAKKRKKKEEEEEERPAPAKPKKKEKEKKAAKTETEEEDEEMNEQQQLDEALRLSCAEFDFRKKPHHGPISVEELENLYNSIDNGDLTVIEHGSGVRKASGATNIEGVGDVKAQYGRIEDNALVHIIESTVGEDFLRPNAAGQKKVFVDLGSGVGNSCIAAAMLYDCDARGVEFIDTRNAIGENMWMEINEKINELKDLPDSVPLTKYGSVELRCKSFTDQTQKAFITAADFVWVNNYEGVYGVRSEVGGNMSKVAVEGDRQELKVVRDGDSHVAALFSQMQVGTVMVTMHKLPNIGLSIEEMRMRCHCIDPNKEIPDDSSWFSLEEINFGEGMVPFTWNKSEKELNTFVAYKYTRKQQDRARPLPGVNFGEDGSHVDEQFRKGKEYYWPHLLCPVCPKSLPDEPAFNVRQVLHLEPLHRKPEGKEVEDHQEQVLMLRKFHCTYCEVQGIEPPNSRQMRRSVMKRARATMDQAKKKDDKSKRS